MAADGSGEHVALAPGGLADLPAWLTAAATALLVPWRLMPYYELRGGGAPGAALALGWVAGASYVAFRLWRSRKGDSATAVGLGLLLLPLLPALPILPRAGSLFSERFLYLPSAGLAIVAGAIFEQVSRGGATSRSALAARAILAPLLIVAGSWTFLRVGDRRDESTLFSRALGRDPDNQVLLYLSGVQKAKAGDPAGARGNLASLPPTP